MALKFNPNARDSIKVIAREDSAIPENISDEQWAEYMRTLREDFLGCTEAPTRFVLRRTLPFDAQTRIQGMQIKWEGKEGRLDMGYMLEEVRCALVGIENPPGCTDPIEFKTDSDGYAAKELVAYLAQTGIAQQLFAARQYDNARSFKPGKK